VSARDAAGVSATVSAMTAAIAHAARADRARPPLSTSTTEQILDTDTHDPAVIDFSWLAVCLRG
jgi:hypothetical protein